MKLIFFCITFLFISVLTAVGQDGEMIDLTIHAVSIEENLVGESPDLSVGVFLPPGYNENITKRYPVIYFFHGWAQRYFGEMADGYSDYEKGDDNEAYNQIDWSLLFG